MSDNVYYVKLYIRLFFRRFEDFFLSPLPACALLVFIFISLPSSNFDGSSWRDRSNVEVADAGTIVLYYNPETPAVEIARHPDLYTENNRILGAHPSVSDVNRHMAVITVAHVAISYYLPRPVRTAWQAITIVEVADAVYNNHRIGITITLHF